MEKKIKKLGEKANKIDFALYREVIALNNHMSECSCDDSVFYDFVNIVCSREVTRFCLNCGGIIVFGK